MDLNARAELDRILSAIATREDVRAEGERLREHMTICMERVRGDIHALIDAIELMKYIDSQSR